MLTFILYVFFGMFLAWNMISQPKWSKRAYERWVKPYTNRFVEWLRSL